MLKIREMQKCLTEFTYIDPWLMYFLRKLQYFLNLQFCFLAVQAQITNISGETVTEGLNVSLRCLSEGNPQPNFTWTSVSDNSVVTMPLINVRRQDAGEYRCIADNGVGKPASETVWLIVQCEYLIIIP